MAAQRGRDLLLKIDTTGAGVFVTVAGLRSRAIAFNAATVDITHAESVGQWRELLAGTGIRSARLSGTGIFKDAASDEAIRSSFFAGTIRRWQVIIPDFGTIDGLFQITGLDLAGQHDAEVTFELALESAGELTFVAA
jgi:TP901-1 family phage major tail protein